MAAFSTSYHGHYHQVTDEAQYLDYRHLAAIAGLVRDVAWQWQTASAAPR